MTLIRPDEQTLRNLIRRQAKGNSNGSAICAPDGRTSLTYYELSSQLDAVAKILRDSGVGRDDCVAVVLPNGPEMAAAFLCIAANCTCAPLNPNYRDSEFRFYFADLQVKAVVVLSGDQNPARTTAENMKVAVIDLVPDKSVAGAFRLRGESVATSIPDRIASPEDIALVLHTSGTTARPKIVPLSHRNLRQSAENIREVLQLTSADRCLNLMPLFHIHGLIGALLSSLAAGASVACCPAFDAGLFFEWWVAIDPTWYTAVPTIHQAVLAQVDRTGGKPDTSSLRLIRSSSASLPPAVMERLEKIFNVPVLESYGMTEASHQMASNPLPPLQRKPGSVGLPAGPEMGIIDENGEQQSTAIVGEIVIRGQNVSEGYVNNPIANAASYVNGWFRTGDQGWKDEDGYYHITGRLKELINRGGEKVMPREVDDVLLNFPGVSQAVSFAVPHATLGEDLAAAVVLGHGVKTTEHELRTHVLNHLAACKVPSRIVFVEEIPKGSTGKIQRIGLFDKLKDRLSIAYVGPQEGAETVLVELWQELLTSQPIGVQDNFFFLGGDSLLAGRLVARIASSFDIDFHIEDIFHAPTIRDQAETIERRLIEQISGRKK